MQPLSDAAVYGAQLPLEPWPLHPHLYECVLIVQWHKMEKWWFIPDLHLFDKLEGTSRLWSIDLWQNLNAFAASREDC